MNIARLVRQKVANAIHHPSRSLRHRTAHLVGEEADDVIEDVMMRTTMLRGGENLVSTQKGSIGKGYVDGVMKGEGG